ncbi:Crp/Fnr family transcriptional regulator [Roseicyclus persicicus]|uniref:Crp/Fnr family transcriptional regulator n=1 Tax=Roseicyclus persicicus TaxID=2650661 RepID=A0A7X6H181_9RHOB|nr:Crp/Fnr family transcriptional regulator [Roseibacterium persicicum]NKX45439.1 Crp/Fnr family transcriptional regulator [Roseibacterium persicicum]
MRNDSGHGAADALATIPEIADLPDEIRAELKTICRIRRFAQGQLVTEVGDTNEMVGYVIDGILRMQKTLPDGRQHVVGLLVAGDMFGRVYDGPSPFAIEAAADSEVCVFQRARFEALLARFPELDRLVLLHFLTELDRARDWMVVLATPKVRGRLAGFLLMLCTRYRNVGHLFGDADGRLTIRIPIGRPDLAHLLGARPESVSRAFHALADDGILEILRPDLVAIRSIEDLAEEAGEPELGDGLTVETLAQAAGGAGR